MVSFENQKQTDKEQSIIYACTASNSEYVKNCGKYTYKRNVLSIIPKRLLYIIPLQNHQHPKKVFLCLPFAGVIASVKLEFSYDHTLIACCLVTLVWLSSSSTTTEKTAKLSKNRSYSKTWNNPSDSLIIGHNEQYHLIVTHQGKVISSNEDIKKLLGSDDPIIVQQIINEIIIRKVDKQIKERKMLNLLEMINAHQPKCKILDCSAAFGDHYMIELINYNDNVGMIFVDLYECKEYWECKITKQLMNQLFRSFSHEFSTSLNCIRILAESAIEDIDDDYVVNNILQPILNSCYILNSIVQDVRDFSLILSKNFIFTIQIQNVYLLINEVADLYRQQLTMKGVELNIKMNEIYIHTDGQRFKQVLNNLLSNAQKFTFTGNITITLTEQIARDQVYVKVSVSDTGSGMNSETQSKLKEFLNQPHKRQSNFNYGLGLMISNSICNGLSPNYESGIHFESNNQNGSVFWFYLEDLKMLETPDLISKRTIKYNKIVSSGRSVLEQSFLISPSDKKRQSSFTFSLKGKQKLIEKNSENFSEPDENICAPYIFRETKKPKKCKHSPIDQTAIEIHEDRVKILIVDDEFVNIYALTTMFSRLNIKCDQAHNGKEGLDKFKQHYYQVILMDIEMPIMNGIQATSLIIDYCHSVDLDPPIIIAQTAYTDMQTKQLCKEAGMDYFLQKPIIVIMNKKILVITDISRTLLLAERLGKQLYLDRRRELDNIKPNDKYENHSIIWRPGREFFLDSLMIKYRDRFDVAVWSSLDRDKTAAFAKSFFGKHFRNLLFVSTCNREQYEGTQKEYSTEPIRIDRDLSLINQKFPNYDLPNIVMVNVFPNLLEQHSFNDIIIPKFDPQYVDVQSDGSLDLLVKYLNGLSMLINKQRVQDIRTAIRAKPIENMDKRMDNLRNKMHEYL
ncbi:unnamed protein product [Paramecium octaurelia]|uniref:Uncharacterized protein n=1 Tax=Paramecium octaurelia TaxID=43137 RepID=A0A8S1WR63_PAROT|nr:unnamed protein product [Paramecium octaurelia]